MNRTFWDQMASMENRMEALARSFGLWTPGTGPMGVLPARPYVPAMDVLARDGDIVIRLDVPGVDPARDLTVTAADGELTIHGERHGTEKADEKDYLRTETFHGVFERHVPLAEGTPVEKIDAKYANGVLEVVIPNAPRPPAAPRPKRIAVKTPAATRS
jgi:HSP20 family molecular chaperone IbpA